MVLYKYVYFCYYYYYNKYSCMIDVAKSSGVAVCFTSRNISVVLFYSVILCTAVFQTVQNADVVDLIDYNVC